MKDLCNNGNMIRMIIKIRKVSLNIKFKSKLSIIIRNQHSEKIYQSQNAYNIIRGQCILHQTIYFEMPLHVFTDKCKILKIIVMIISANGAVPAGFVVFNTYPTSVNRQFESVQPLERSQDSQAQMRFIHYYELCSERSYQQSHYHRLRATQFKFNETFGQQHNKLIIQSSKKAIYESNNTMQSNNYGFFSPKASRTPTSIRASNYNSLKQQRLQRSSDKLCDQKGQGNSICNEFDIPNIKQLLQKQIQRLKQQNSQLKQRIRILQGSQLGSQADKLEKQLRNIEKQLQQHLNICSRKQIEYNQTISLQHEKIEQLQKMFGQEKKKNKKNNQILAQRQNKIEQLIHQNQRINEQLQSNLGQKINEVIKKNNNLESLHYYQNYYMSLTKILIKNTQLQTKLNRYQELFKIHNKSKLKSPSKTHK